MRCPNPLCPAGSKHFVTARAYSQHVHHSTPCFEFISNSSTNRECLRSHRKRANGMETSGVASTQRPRVLRRAFQKPTLFENAIPQHMTNSRIHDVESLFGMDDFDDIDIYASQHQFIFSTDQKWTVKLLKLLNNIEAPDHLFGDIMLWARTAMSEGYTFCPSGGLSRHSNIQIIVASMHNANQLLPVVKPVTHAAHTHHVIVFDFVSQLLHLLQNKAIMIQDNLLIDVNNPLIKYQDPNG